MSQSIKKRLEKIRDRISPGYLKYEDLLTRIHLLRQKNRSREEQRTLNELNQIPIDPELEASFKEIRERRQERCHNED